MRVICTAYRIVDFVVSDRNWEVDFFESKFGRIEIESELSKSIWEKRNSFPTFDFKECRIYESFSEFLDLNNLLSFTS